MRQHRDEGPPGPQDPVNGDQRGVEVRDVHQRELARDEVERPVRQFGEPLCVRLEVADAQGLLRLVAAGGRHEFGGQVGSGHLGPRGGEGARGGTLAAADVQHRAARPRRRRGPGWWPPRGRAGCGRDVTSASYQSAMSDQETSAPAGRDSTTCGQRGRRPSRHHSACVPRERDERFRGPRVSALPPSAARVRALRGCPASDGSRRPRRPGAPLTAARARRRRRRPRNR